MPTNAASGSWCTINLIRPAADSTQRTTTPCEEYQRKTSTDPTTGAIQETVTIESQDASPFEISFHIKPTTYSSIHQAATNSNKPQSAKNNNLQSLAHDDYVIDVYLDGIGVGSTTIHKSDPFPDSIDKIVIGQSLCRLLQFAPVNLVDPDDHQNSDDNDNICEDKKVIMSLGTIQFDVTRCVAVLEQSRPFTNEDGIQTTNQMNFSERFKKACLATTAGLGQPQVNQLYPETEWRATNADPKPFLQFIFRYKPRAILESEGKITPTVQEVAAKTEQGNKIKTDIEKNKNKNRMKNEHADQKSGQKEDRKPKMIDLTRSDKNENQKPKIIDLTGSDKPMDKNSNFIDLTGSDISD